MTIENDQEHPWLWDLCLNGSPLRKGYTDPDQAAFEANAKDVGDPRINSILQGVYVPSDLRNWSPSPLKQFPQNNQRN